MSIIPEIFESESNFCLIVWKHEPVTGGALVKLCEQQLGWKKSTTYTVIKRLCERGVIEMNDGVVTSLVSKKQVGIAKVASIADKYFDGSFPALTKAWKNPDEYSDNPDKSITTAKDISPKVKKALANKPVQKRRTASKPAKASAEKPEENQESHIKQNKIPSFLL